MRKMRKTDALTLRMMPVIFSLLLNGPFQLNAQAKDSIVVKKNVIKVVTRSAAIYAAGMTTLSFAWYDQNRQSFTWFDDTEEWKQMDKAGHFFTTFHVSRVMSANFRKAGLNTNKAALAGSLSSFLALTSIEILDGYAPRYGASTSDIGANLIGGLFYFFQRNKENDPLFYPKFSFYPSNLASRRPEMLGKNFSEQILKDYNGQTYWLSVDMDQISTFPVWLNVAIGHGATGMIYARDKQNNEVGLSPYRKWYLGLDIDLSDIQTKRRLLRQIFSVVRIIRIPAPAIEFSNGKFTISPLGF